MIEDFIAFCCEVVEMVTLLWVVGLVGEVDLLVGRRRSCLLLFVWSIIGPGGCLARGSPCPGRIVLLLGP